MVGTSAAAAWSVEEVVAWLEQQVGLREHSPAFRTNGIDGEMLLLLSEAPDLCSGLTLGVKSWAPVVSAR